MENYKQILINHGIKPTFQRIKILEYLDKNKNHPTVDMIYSSLYPKVPTLSKTTVYNTLQIMQKRGLVSIMSSIDTESRFDYNYDFHHHFICRNCGKINDIYIDCNLKEKLIAEGHQVDEAHGSFYGVCRDCLKTIS